MKYNVSIIAFLLSVLPLFGQSPSYFTNNTENGAPSNEVYCLLQDKSGYIWIGCDAGVYRFNGIEYQHLTSSKLTARAATGLTQAPNGRIYGYNFNRQLFYIENEQLHVLKEWDKPINGIAADKQGAIWISSSEGAFRLNEKNLTITEIKSDLHVSLGKRIFTSHAISDNSGSVYYHNGNNIVKWKDGIGKTYFIGNQYFDIPLLISKYSDEPWIFDLIGEKIFKYELNSWVEYENSMLNKVLKGRKINAVFETKDGYLWIATYSGIVRFHIPSQTVEVLYDQFSFSSGLKDNEGNLWFSTLNNGIIRIPEMGVRIWKYPNSINYQNQFSHIACTNGRIYFGETTGSIGIFDIQKGTLKKYSHEPSSDIGMFYLDKINNILYFNKLNSIYKFDKGQFLLVNENARPLKNMLQIKEGFFMLSSQGLFFTKQPNEKLSSVNLIDESWYRDITASSTLGKFYAASNNGLVVIKNQKGKYIIDKRFLIEKQIISVNFDEISKKVFCLTFEGIIYQLDDNGKLKQIKQLDKEYRATQLKMNQGRIFLATNKGIIMIDLASGIEKKITKYEGLSSNNVRAISFDDKYCWATGDNGIQQIPLYLFQLKRSKPTILSQGVKLNGKKIAFQQKMEIDNSDELTLEFDGMSYRSNGNFQYAYRFKGYSQKWIKIPGSLGEIAFASLPTGKLTIEIKLIDHTGSDSFNRIEYQFYVAPPFWQRWWFYLLISLVTIGLAMLIFKKRVIMLRVKQEKELQQLKLENELRLAQQNALKAQMNPHFLFNVLNSIKGYIYENDKKNAAKYLNEFSNLVRKILEMSSLPVVSLEKELEALQLYIDLESMLLQSELKFTLEIDENVDVSGIKIPTLLIQPYVENAFKHGLRHLSGEKELKIFVSYQEMEEILEIKIEDNGIGRKASENMKEKSPTNHQPFASEAMKHRLELLNYNKKEVISIEYIDKFNEVDKPIGTQIIIRIHV